MSARTPFSAAALDKLQRDSFDYFLHETNPVNGLVIDRTAADWPASIAATGLALASYPIGVSAASAPRRVSRGRDTRVLSSSWWWPG
jgi:hypothetical protein